MRFIRSLTWRVCGLAVAMMCVASPVHAQIIDPPGVQRVTAVSTGGGCATTESCASVSVGNAPSVTFSVTGTFTGTLTFEATADNGTWFTLTVVQQSNLSQVSTTTGTGLFGAPNTGVLQMRVRATAWTSGTALVTVTRGYGTLVSQRAPSSAVYWLGAANTSLSSAVNLGAIGTGLVLNTAGTPSAYGGASCTNQFLRSLNASGSGTCASVALGTDTTGTLGLTNGGTNGSLTASNGGLFYSTASAAAILAGTATANQIPLSGSNAAPSWSTATYPATTTANRLFYSSSNNVVTDLATGNNGVLITSGAGVPSISSTIPSATQDNITRVGTITSGTWTGTAIAVANGGNGAAPGADDQIMVSDSTTAGTYRAVPNCTDASGNHLNYTAATNSFSCGTTSSGTAGAITLLCANAGTDTTASATNVATCAISGLTAADQLQVWAYIETITQATANTVLYNSTDSVALASLSAGGALAAADVFIHPCQILQGQNAATRVISYCSGGKIGTSNQGQGADSTFTTNWTGSWTLALRHGGVTAGGTFRWRWTVLKVVGQ